MDITCPRCGKTVSANEYFCSDCGHPLFEPGSEHAGKGGFDQPGPRLEDPAAGGPYPETLDTIEQYPGREGAGTPRTTTYKPPSRKNRKFRISWGWMVAAMVIAIFVLGSYFAYALFHVPAIKTTPPPGWSDAPDLLVDMTRDALEEAYGEAELDYLFCKLDDVSLDVHGKNISVSSDVITVAHVKYVLFDSMPETESIGEMQSYLSSQWSLISTRLGEEAELKKLEPMKLSCGNVGMYVLVSPEGSRLDIEELVVKKKNTLYLIIVAQPGSMRFPSEDMMYLSENITFD